MPRLRSRKAAPKSAMETNGKTGAFKVKVGGSVAAERRGGARYNSR